VTAERAANHRSVGIDALVRYPDRIDVRSPLEFAHDHVPGASSHPVLDNEERARIGTLYAASPFEARKAGAALIARNIAHALETALRDRPRDWAPLVYCWRGGQRSRALAHILNEVGWRAVQLEGGYRAWRRHVVSRLHALPQDLQLTVISGLTGSGKSRFLSALAAEGAQIIDLEGLARHRGSLLGDLPSDPQPSQKYFESQLLVALEAIDPARPVFVESESRRIGTLQVPDALLDRMRAAPALRLSTPRELRIALLCEDYAHFISDAESLRLRLERLAPLHGKATLERWHSNALAGDWSTVVGELLDQHYDPTYHRSLAENFGNIRSRPLEVSDTSAKGFAALARDFLRDAEQNIEQKEIPSSAHERILP